MLENHFALPLRTASAGPKGGPRAIDAAKDDERDSLTEDRRASENRVGVGDSENIAKEWRDLVVSPCPWTPAPNAAGAMVDDPAEGEGGGFFVVSERWPVRAYLKPVRKDRGPFRCRAAREKIVSDLAFDLGILVPPVLLYIRDCPAGEESLCCVSLVMRPKQFPWNFAKQFLRQADRTTPDPLGDPIRAALPLAAAHGMALDAWVMQADHNDHPNNILFGYRADQRIEFVFLDYALTLGHVWSTHDSGRKANGWKCWKDAEGWKAQVKCPLPPLMERAVDRQELDAMITKIEGFSPETIKEVVHRVPTDYLENSERDIIATALIERRSLIRTSLQSQLAGTTEK